MRGNRRRLVIGAVLVWGVGVSGSAGLAEPLAPERCEQLKVEQQALVEAKIPDVVRQGPAWAKANVGADKIKAAERYIQLQEQLLFRCGLAKLKALPAGAGDEIGDGSSVPAALRTEPPAEPAPKALPKPKPKPKAASDEEPVPPKATRPKAPPKPHAKAKPKSDDAYRPLPKAEEAGEAARSP